LGYPAFNIVSPCLWSGSHRVLRLQALPAGRRPPQIYREVRIRHVIRIGLQVPGATPVPGCELREHGQQHSQRAGKWLCFVLGEPAASFDRRQD